MLFIPEFFKGQIGKKGPMVEQRIENKITAEQ